MIRGYVLIETEVGATQSVGDTVRALRSAHARIIAVDTVTGPYDVIVQLEAEDLDRLGKAITGEVATVPGVQRTTTCLSVNLG
jgi:DNA-binding Lrp family transcriptional regulator